jgi:lysophospholipase
MPKSPGKPNFIFAHSMGGAVTTLFLANHPKLVSRAVLSTPMHEMQLGGLPRWSALSLVYVGSKIGRGTSYAFGQQAPHFPENFEKAATQSHSRWKWFADYAGSPNLRASALGGATNHWVLEVFGVTNQFMREGFPQKIRIPVLLFQAGRDTWVGDKGQNFFCQHAPDCELIRYQDAKHEIYWEKDSLRTPYLQKILSFFAKP